jgi:hypothetical protein
MTSKDTQDEVRQIEHDLENLRRRNVTLDRSAHRMKVTFYVFLGLLVVLIAAAAVMGKIAPLVATVFALVVTCITAYAASNQRWIDRAMWVPWGILVIGMKRTEAMAVEDMVAERMARLAELKGERK